MRVVTVATAVLLVTLGTSPAGATTLFVPKDYPTIQAAVDAAVPFDVIKVAKGTFAPFTVFDKRHLTVKGTRGKTVVDGASVAAVVVHIRGSDHITLDRLSIRYANDRGVDIDDSPSVTVRRCRIFDAYDGIRAHGAGGTLIEKNRFRDIENDAVDFSNDFSGPAHDSQVRKNRFVDVGHEAVEIEGANHLVEKNRIERAGGNGIRLEPSAEDATVRKNRIAGTGDDGIVAVGTGHTIEKNAVSAAGDEGIAINASSSVVRANRVKKAADNGIEVGVDPGVATNNSFERNTVVRSVRSGFVVADGGNTFVRNRAAGSGVYDLVDTAGAGANVYEKNRFRTEQTP